MKYTTGDGRIVKVKIGSTSAWVRHRYTADEVDWIAVYDATTERCYYVHSSVWDGHTTMNLRVVPPANGQKKAIRFAELFTSLGGGDASIPSGSTDEPPLPFDSVPE